MIKRASTKPQIIQAAIELASKEGLHAISIAKIAEKVGMSKSGLFGHFKSKERLQIELLQAEVDRFVHQVIQPAIQSPKGIPRIEKMYELWKSRVVGNRKSPGGCLIIATATEVDDRPGRVKNFLIDQINLLIVTLSKSAQLAVDVGQFKSDLDTQKFAFELYSSILGYHLYHRLLQHPQAEALSDRSFSELLIRSQSTTYEKGGSL